MKINTSLPVKQPTKGDMVAIDIEMFDQNVEKLHRPHGRFACISIAHNGQVYQFYDKDSAAKALKFFESGQWIFQNAVYDIRQLRGLGIKIVDRPVWDTFLVDRVLWGGFYSTFSLSDMARRYLNIELKKDTREEFGKKHDVMTKAMKEYAAKDALVTLQLAEHQSKSIDSNSRALYWLVDAPMIWVVLALKPVKVDPIAWMQLVNEFDKQAQKRQDALGFNVNSQKQVIAETLKRYNIKLKDTKAETLKKYAEDVKPLSKGRKGLARHEYFQEILDIRSLRKAVSTYGQTWLDRALEKGDLIWSNWNITGAETGRMSSDKPNLQNIPVRNVRMGMDKYRTLFISDGGKFIISDVAQQEPRITAFLSQDRNLLKALSSGEDIHLYVAREIFNNPKLTKKDKEERDLGKTINLGLTYGLSVYGLSTRTGLSEEEAADKLESYFERFPGVQEYINTSRSKAQLNEYVVAPGGRKIWLNMYDYQWANNAVNAPVQGGAANHTKLTLSIIYKKCQDLKIEFPVCLVVHDEIVADVKEDLRLYKKLIKESWLEAAAVLFPGIPFEIELHVGTNWGAKSEEE
jgi:DNA polymerase-1